MNTAFETALLTLSLFSLVVNYVAWKILKEINHQHKRDIRFLEAYNQNLVDRIMHMSGNTWTLPPRETQNDDGELTEDLQRALEGWKEV